VLRSEQVGQICELVKRGGVVKLSGVWGSSAPLLAAAVGTAKNAPVLLVCTHPDDADAVADDVEVLTGQPAEILPAWELELDNPAGPAAMAIDHVSDEIVGERLGLCSLLARGEGPRFIVAATAALLQPVPSPQVLAAARLAIDTGQQFPPEWLVEWLVDAGFDRVDQIDQQGDFARRGGIVDIFPPGVSCPVRVEFAGDQVESIRRFDLDTQRSTDQIDGCELIATAAGRETDPDRTATFAEYLPAETIVCVIEPA